MILLSNNKASMARACWMKYKFYAVDGLKPLKKSRALALGEVVHAAFDQIYSGVLMATVLQRISDSYDATLNMCQPEEVEDLKVDKMTALGMVQFYPIEYGRFDSVEPEVEFEAKLGWGSRLIGRVDGKVSEHGKKWIRELKTTSMTQAQFEGRAHCSYQASTYKYGLEQDGDKYEGIMYDYIRKPRLYKRETDNADSYGKRIYEDYALTEKVDSKKKSYFGRIYVYRNDFEMECFKSDMLKMVKEMRQRTKKGDFPRNPDACFLYNRPCEYSVICWKRHVQADLIKAYFTVKGESKAPESIVTGEDGNGD